MPRVPWWPRPASSPGGLTKDKHIVAWPEIEPHIDWTGNRPLDPDRFTGLRDRAVAHLRGHELFVQDLHAGADPDYRLRVRVVTEQAWHNLFARNMFIRPAAADLAAFEPDWTVLQVPSFEADPTIDGTASPTVIALDFRHRLVLIGGTAYAGEIKKSIFTVLNYLLPEQECCRCTARPTRLGRRRRRVLRPVGHRQDDALGRSRAHADRR